MMFKYKFKTPFFLKIFYPECEWDVPSKEKKIYLTFDDGPIPEVTEYVLEVLKKHNCKATFFCVGENIYKNPHIYKKIILEGHQVGNHTYNHLNGWNAETEAYIRNVKLCQEIMEDTVKDKEVTLFRPPYGKLKKNQSHYLRKQYRIIMWDILTRDFDQNLNPNDCLKAANKYSKEGSIIIFHDSLKARKNMKAVLPDYIESCLERGFSFSCL